MVLLIALGVVGSLFYFVNWGIFANGQSFAQFLWSFGVFSFVTGITGTKIGLPAYWAWMGFVYVVSSLIGYGLLTLVFYLVITPLGLVGRLLSRDKFQIRSNRVESFWHVVSSNNTHNPERPF